MSTNYKSCPLKKRPIVYVRDEEDLVQQPNVQSVQALSLTTKYSRDCNSEGNNPQDLSLKRKASDSFKDYVVPEPQEYPLDLSKKSSPTTLPIFKKRRSVSPVKALSCSSVMLSPPSETDSTMVYQPSDIHLRGMSAFTTSYTTNPYQTAFAMAAGCHPMTALWNTYGSNIPCIYPSPVLSFNSAASPLSGYSGQNITPPLSPRSEVNFEPEDLTARSDIPLPALYHVPNEAPSNISFNASASSVNSHKTSASCSSSTFSSHSAGNNNSKNYRFKCDKCEKMYSTSIGLSKHLQFHCPDAECNQKKKKYECGDCGKLYTTMGALKMHIRTHTLPCKCPICSKAFSRPWLLQGHIRTHTGEKPFKCPDCPRSFADRSNLRAHQQTHAEVKKYACEVCKKTFSRMSLLNKHASSNCTITIL